MPKKRLQTCKNCFKDNHSYCRCTLKIPKVCIVCNKHFDTKAAIAKFCSKDCFLAWKRKRWKEQYGEYHKKYYQKNKERLLARQRSYAKKNRKLISERSKERYRKNIIKIKQYSLRPDVRARKQRYMLKWEADHKKKRTAYWKKHYSKLEVKARKRGNMNRWRKANIEHEKSYRRTVGKANQKRYLKTEKGIISGRLIVQRRLARLRKVIHSFSKADWIRKLELSGGRCNGCGVTVGMKNLELDHIYPLNAAYKDYKITKIKRIYTIEDIQPLCMPCNRVKSDNIIESTNEKSIGMEG